MIAKVTWRITICLLACMTAAAADATKHWAFVKPVRPALPEVRNAQWPRNAIDYFVLARLEKEGIAPSAEASRETLVRRLYLDLIGLPPYLAEDRLKAELQTFG